MGSGGSDAVTLQEPPDGRTCRVCRSELTAGRRQVELVSLGWTIAVPEETATAAIPYQREPGLLANRVGNGISS